MVGSSSNPSHAFASTRLCTPVSYCVDGICSSGALPQSCLASLRLASPRRRYQYNHLQLAYTLLRDFNEKARALKYNDGSRVDQLELDCVITSIMIAHVIIDPQQCSSRRARCFSPADNMSEDIYELGLDSRSFQRQATKTSFVRQ